MITAERYHDICCGHRVVGHENKCKYLHGHNYRFEFSVAGDLDDIGRVMDFSVIKEKLCEWLEENLDHKFLIWKEDPFLEQMKKMDGESLVIVDYNPTAENIAQDFIENIAPKLLEGTGTKLVKLKLWETRKCSVTVELK